MDGGKSTGLVGISLIIIVSVAIGGAVLAAGYPLIHKMIVQWQHVDEAKDMLPQQLTCSGEKTQAQEVIGCGGVTPANMKRQQQQAATERKPSPPREGIQLPDSLQD